MPVIDSLPVFHVGAATGSDRPDGVRARLCAIVKGAIEHLSAHELLELAPIPCNGDDEEFDAPPPRPGFPPAEEPARAVPEKTPQFVEEAASRIVDRLCALRSVPNGWSFDGAHSATPLLPPEFYEVLQASATSDGSAGIVEIKLRSQGSATAPLGSSEAALRHFPNLTCLQVECDASANLSVLQVPALKRIEILPMGLRADRPFEITLPDGVKAVAKGFRKSDGKVTVRYVDSAGLPVGKPRPLRGLTHIRRPDAFADAPPEDFPAVASRARKNLNMQSRFLSPASDDGIGDKIVCRHLMIKWLQMRTEYLSERQGALAGRARPAESKQGVPQRFSFAPLMSTPEIAQNVGVEAEQAYEEVFSTRPQALTDFSSFGSALQEQFERMKEGGESVRHFALLTDTHGMAVELQIKEELEGSQASTAYVVTFYDPNETRTHSRTTFWEPSDVREFNLEHFVGAKRYAYPWAGTRLAALHAWPPAARDRSAGVEQEVSLHVDGIEAVHSPEMLEWLLHAGEAARDPAIVALALDPEPTPSSAGYPAALRRGLTRIMLGAAGAEELVSRVAASSKIGPGAKKEILCPSYDSHGQLGTRTETPLALGFRHANAKAVAGFTRGILSAPEDALGAEERLEMLLSLMEGADDPASPPRIVPALHDACDPRSAKPYHARFRSDQHRAIGEYLGAILSSDRVPFEHKLLICRSESAGLSAAQAALARGNAGAAAAVACAILESGQSAAAKRDLLASLHSNAGPPAGLADIVRALKSSPSLENEFWIARILDRVGELESPRQAWLARDAAAHRMSDGS